MAHVLKFSMNFDGWTPAGEVFPIVSIENDTVIGGFTIGDAASWKCFIASSGYYESLYVADGTCFITPSYASDGSIDKLTVSRRKIAEESRTFTPEES